MRDHFDAVKALLAPLNRRVYVIGAPSAVEYPYFLLWGLPGTRSTEALDGRQVVVNDLLRVTSVGKTPESAMELQRLSRDALIEAVPVVAGRTVHALRMFDSQPIQADRDIVLPDVNRNPFYGVDIYRLVSEPAPANA